MSRNKKIGTAWESAIVAFLRDKGFSYAERRALSGSHDQGDLTGIPGICIEAKHVNRLDLSGWLDEAELERDNAHADVGAVWLKRRGFTSPGRAYVLLSGDDFVWLLKSAGYGDAEAGAA
jgi:hypothetical protein